MNIAEKKKNENIAEYVIHMYQTEDLIRVYNFDISQIDEYVIKHIPVGQEEKKELRMWYNDIIMQMEKEGIESRGHLTQTQAVVKELSILSDELRKSDEKYKKIYWAAKPHIDESLSMAYGLVEGDIQACFNGIYGLLLARMHDQNVDDGLMEGIDKFGTVLSYLAAIYKYRRIA
jgi:hypothetical protein